MRKPGLLCASLFNRRCIDALSFQYVFSMSGIERPRRSELKELSPALGRSDARRQGLARAIGLGLITGAADDDPSAIGTYASAGAKFGTTLLWMAPVTFPMMFAVVYRSAKLGQVTDEGLFAVLRRHYPRKVLFPTLIGVLIGNTIEAGADLGGIAAALNLLVPIPILILVPILGFGIGVSADLGFLQDNAEHFPCLGLGTLGVCPSGHPSTARLAISV